MNLTYLPLEIASDDKKEPLLSWNARNVSSLLSGRSKHGEERLRKSSFGGLKSTVNNGLLVEFDWLTSSFEPSNSSTFICSNDDPRVDTECFGAKKGLESRFEASNWSKMSLALDVELILKESVRLFSVSLQQSETSIVISSVEHNSIEFDLKLSSSSCK